MTGIGTLVNVCAIILGGFLGLLFKGGLKQHYQDAVLRCLGLCTLFIGAAGGLSGLLSVSGTRLESGGSLGMILSLVLGTLVGERLNLEGRLEEGYYAYLTQAEANWQALNSFLEEANSQYSADQRVWPLEVRHEYDLLEV